MKSNNALINTEELSKFEARNSEVDKLFSLRAHLGHVLII